MMGLVKLISLSLLCGIVAAQDGPTEGCTTYDVPNGICNNLLTYPVSPLVSPGYAEQGLEDRRVRLLKVILMPYPQCYASYVAWACSSAFPKCEETANVTMLFLPCRSTCDEAYSSCKSIFESQGLTAYLPNCSGKVSGSRLPYPNRDEKCVAFTTTGNSSQTINPLLTTDTSSGKQIIQFPPQCPDPLVSNPNFSIPLTRKRPCVGACCLPCPHLNAFFPKGSLTAYQGVTDTLRALSAILSLVIVVSYLLLPEKRKQPIIVCFMLAVFVYCLPIYLNFGRRTATQCGDDGVSEADQGSNTLCAVQGSIAVFGFIAGVLWCSFMILNMHMTIVWNKHVLRNKLWIAHIFCWGLPLLITTLAVYLRAMAFQFGSICFLTPEQAPNLFFYPMSPFILISFLLQVWTAIYVGRITMKAARTFGRTLPFLWSSRITGESTAEENTKRAIKGWQIHWRSYCVTSVILITYFYFYIFYFTQMTHIYEIDVNTQFLKDWFTCILHPDGTQDACSSISTPHLPPYFFLVLSEALPGVVGIWLFVVYAFRPSILSDWRSLLRSWRARRARQAQHQNHTGHPQDSPSNIPLNIWRNDSRRTAVVTPVLPAVSDPSAQWTTRSHSEQPPSPGRSPFDEYFRSLTPRPFTPVSIPHRGSTSHPLYDNNPDEFITPPGSPALPPSSSGAVRYVLAYEGSAYDPDRTTGYPRPNTEFARPPPRCHKRMQI
ncbi:hypothetical protein DFS34DRAFT_327539 [Phlyctochytrium arcticum]|nr:hypothetical protein DFS34DRAFT_327539 [Phlyctochytrium arcticum]